MNTKLFTLIMCFLFDASTIPKTNQEHVQKMIQAYSKCGIALKPYVFNIKSNYANDFIKITGQALLACPIPAAFQTRGSIQIESRYADLPKQMCHNPDAKGCSMLCNPLSISIVEPGASFATRLHESMHSNCCGPLCVDRGEGNGKSALEISDNASTIPPEICKALASGASPTNIQNWFDDPRLQSTPELHDLMAGKSFFGYPIYEVIKEPPKPVITEVLTPGARKLLGNLVTKKIEEPVKELVEVPPVKEKAIIRASTLIEVGVSRRRGASLRRGSVSDIATINDPGAEDGGD